MRQQLHFTVYIAAMALFLFILLLFLSFLFFSFLYDSFLSFPFSFRFLFLPFPFLFFFFLFPFPFPSFSILFFPFFSFLSFPSLFPLFPFFFPFFFFWRSLGAGRGGAFLSLHTTSWSNMPKVYPAERFAFRPLYIAVTIYDYVCMYFTYVCTLRMYVYMYFTYVCIDMTEAKPTFISRNEDFLVVHRTARK